jgi:hypothetical protein
MAHTGHGAAAAGLHRGLHRRRVEQRVIAGCHGIDQVGQHEADACRVGLVQAGVRDQVLRGLRCRQVRLHRPAQQRVARPARIGEPAVAAGWLDLRRAGGDTGQLADQPAAPAGEEPGPPGQRRGQAQSGASGVRAAQHADGRVGEQQVQGRCRSVCRG